MAGGRQLAAQVVHQLVVGQPRHGQGAHFRQVDAAQRVHSEGAVHIQAAAPEAQHHAVAGSHRAVFLAFGEITLKKIGPVGQHAVGGPGGRARPADKADTKESENKAE